MTHCKHYSEKQRCLYNLLKDGRQEKLTVDLEATLNAEKCSICGNYDKGVYLLAFYAIASTTTFYIQIQKYCSHLHHYPAMHLLQLLLQCILNSHNLKVSSTLLNSAATCYSESCLSYEVIASCNHIPYLGFCDINSSLSSFHSVLPSSMMDILCFPLQDSKVNLAREIGIKHFKFGTLLLEDETGAHISALELQLHMNVQSINCHIFQEWFSGGGRQPVSWETLISVLEDIGLDQLLEMHFN